MVLRRCEKLRGGPFFQYTGPQKNAVAHRRLHRTRSAVAAAAAAANACGYGKIPAICWRFVCYGLEAKYAAALDDLCGMVKKMSMPESAKDLDARSMP